MQRWIPVTERLPEEDKEVLVYSHGDMYVWHIKTGNRGNTVWEDEYGYWCSISCSTHWMPLPEPPKKGETRYE